VQAEDTTLRDSQRERISLLLFYGVVLLLAYFLYEIFSPFLAPLAWAAVLAIFVFPWHELLVRRYRTASAAALSTTIVTVVIVVPGLLVLTAAVREGTTALSQVDRDTLSTSMEWAQQRWERLRPVIPGARDIELHTLAEEAAQRIGGFLAARVGGLLADLLEFLFKLFVMLFALFFFLRDADAIVRQMRRLLPFEQSRRERMMQQTQDLVHASITAGLVIATIQGLLGGLLFAMLRIDAPVFWGVAMGFFSFLPFFGTWVIWLPAGVWLLMSGEIARGLLLIGLGTTVVGGVDNFARPALLSGRTRMNGLLMFISLLGGMGVFGLLGLVLGPLVVALTMGLLEAYSAPPDIVAPSL
jgi:predicted PurR-regulated permease PerM